ncbi:MAG: hypothetical protein PHV42_02455 [Candidatus Pacebacteria bacterium]|nr:hypothetical protein [Candidatus Paceibacterota bacterium]
MEEIHGTPDWDKPKKKSGTGAFIGIVIILIIVLIGGLFYLRAKIQERQAYIQYGTTGSY